ncbi:MAG: hypothetical protein IPM29_11680 [Planctomycetes bacterium]|nr:hypothetical protein [Planctomycetota bacterium]
MVSDCSPCAQTGSRPPRTGRRVCYDHGVQDDVFAERAAIRGEVWFH